MCIRQSLFYNGFLSLSPLSSNLYTTYYWARATSHDVRACGVVPTQAQSGLESPTLKIALAICQVFYRYIFFHQTLQIQIKFRTLVPKTQRCELEFERTTFCSRATSHESTTVILILNFTKYMTTFCPNRKCQIGRGWNKFP